MKRFSSSDNILLVVLFACAACANGPQTDRSASMEDSVPSADAQAESARQACADVPVAAREVTAALGDSVALRSGHSIRIAEEGLAVHLVDLVNSPCPEGVTCVWEGVGLALRYEKEGQVEEGMNRVRAFGYTVTVIATDYETCAVLRIDRDG